MRAEGEPRIAMMTMVVPAVLNFILDPIFIAYLGWGLRGAALATTLGYMASGLYALWFFLFGKSELSLRKASLRARGDPGLHLSRLKYKVHALCMLDSRCVYSLAANGRDSRVVPPHGGARDRAARRVAATAALADSAA